MLCFDRWLAFVTHDVVKYPLAAGGLYVLVYGVLAARLASRRLQTARASLRQIAREVGWSLVSADLIRNAGFELAELSPGYARGPHAMVYMDEGQAVGGAALLPRLCVSAWSRQFKPR
jgi:hypothetical protein